MNVHGFWNKANARNFKDRSVLKTEPTPPPGRRSPGEHEDGSWRYHPDQAAVARALVATCSVQEVKS